MNPINSINPNFRLDRFLTLYFFYPLLKLKRERYNLRIPILMYHSISEPDGKQKHPYYETCTSPQVFAEHMKFLHENDYKVISLDQAVEILKYSKNIQKSQRAIGPNKFTPLTFLKKRSGTNLIGAKQLNQPEKYVVLTFDDGFRNFYTDAFPILKEYNFPATVFLPTDFIGTEKNKLRGKEHLTWGQVSELSDSGINFGSHTVTHPELSNLSNKDIEYEIKQSKKTIEYKLGKAINTFSYPFKFPEEKKVFVKNLREILIKHEYRHGVSTRIGTTSKSDDIYFMKRIPINTGDDSTLFQAKLERGYNWLHKPQHLYKSLKRKLQGKRPIRLLA